MSLANRTIDLASKQVLVAADGTAAAPSITNDGDTNTGMFFPAADTIAFSEGGVESMRIDSSGRVGIGTNQMTSSGADLHIFRASGATVRLDRTGAGTCTIQSAETGVSLRDLTLDANTLLLNTANTERLRIDSSGNVGIGNTSPSSYNSSGDNLVIGNAGDNGITIVSGTDGKGYLFFADGVSGTNAYAGQVDFDHSVNALKIGVLGTERLRIDSSGRVGIGVTSPVNTLQSFKGATAGVPSAGAGGHSIAFGSDGYGIAGGALTSGDSYLQVTRWDGTAANYNLLLQPNGGEVYIAGTTDQGAYNLQVNGTGVWGAGAYVNGSDERLKENIQDITSGLDVVEKLRPVSFQYKEEYTADRSVQSGFIAQDLLVALEGKNYLEGVVSQGPTYYNVAYQNLIPILAKAIQELKTINNSQAQTITSLESRITALEAA